MNASDFGRFVFENRGFSGLTRTAKQVYDSSGLISAATVVGGAFAPEVAAAAGTVALGYGIYKVGKTLW